MGTTFWNIFLVFVLPFIQLRHAVHSAVPAQVTIGGIFASSPEGAAASTAFKVAVDFINNETTILPTTQLKYIINQSDSLDPLANVQKACYQISQGVTAVFCPATSTDVKAVSTITSSLEVPVYAPYATNPSFSSDYTNFPYLLRMVPSDAIATRMISDIFTKFLWKRLAILTSNSDFGMGATTQFQLIAMEKEWSILTTQKFEAISNTSKLNVRDNLRVIREKGVRVVLLHCFRAYIPTIMKQAKELEMIQGWAWIALDAGYDTVMPVPEETIGLLGVRPIIEKGTLFSVLTSKLSAAGYTGSLSSIEVVKAFDSVVAFAYGLDNYLKGNHSLSTERPTCGSCNGDSVSKTNGETLMKYLREVQTNGASHFLNFSKDGSPGVSKFEVINLQKNGWITVGDWDARHGLSLDASKREVTWPGSTTDIPIDTDYRFGNTTLRIVTVLEPGYIQLKPTKTHSDPDAYEGFCIDLIKRMAEDMDFKYTLSFVADGKYGSYDPVSKRWNGMVGELVDKKYDMALAPMAISQSRQKVVDFSKPYTDLGLSILMKLPSKPETNIFGFVDPFSKTVWLTGLSVTVVIGFISLFIDKISPNGYYGSIVQGELDEDYEKSEIEDELEGLTYMNLTNSMWFSFGALLQQGGDVLPKSISGRTVAAFWWASSMILIATYTANLAAFLTFNRMKLTITSVEELGSQMDVRYGTVRDSPAQEFFQNSIFPSFNGMYQFMETRGTLVSTPIEGIERVRKENFAFIFDSLYLFQATFKEPCDLFTVGKVFGNFGYGLAFHKDSPYTTRFSLEIYRLREAGVILELEDYWLKTQGDCTPDLTILKPSTGQQTLDDMIGVLYCVYAGIAAGFIFIVVEWCVASYWEVDPTDPEKPNSWRQAMRSRMGRTWKNIRESWPDKLKCCKKKSDSRKVSVNSIAMKSKKEGLKSESRAVDYTGYDNDVHPFQISEK